MAVTSMANSSIRDFQKTNKMSGIEELFVPAKTSNTATGSYTDANDFTWDYHDFTSSGSFVVTTAGWADLLVVGGGGSSNRGSGGAGGGGGGVRHGMFYLEAGTITVTVGAGGTAGGNGGTTSFGTVLISGGGGLGFATENGDFIFTPYGGGGYAGAISSRVSSNAPGAGAGGTVLGSNTYDGIDLNYTNAVVEFGAGGVTSDPPANTGWGGKYTADNSPGGAGRVVVKVLA